MENSIDVLETEKLLLAQVGKRVQISSPLSCFSVRGTLGLFNGGNRNLFCLTVASGTDRLEVSFFATNVVVTPLLDDRGLLFITLSG